MYWEIGLFWIYMGGMLFLGLEDFILLGYVNMDSRSGNRSLRKNF